MIINEWNMNEIMNFAVIYPVKRMLGPMLRMTLWVQGCLSTCPSCITSNWISPASVDPVTPKGSVNGFTANSEIAGITLSGGEPMFEAVAVKEMLFNSAQCNGPPREIFYRFRLCLLRGFFPMCGLKRATISINKPQRQ
jgi:anaerobic ribonucleoside-triphosphate reductase activating protein